MCLHWWSGVIALLSVNPGAGIAGTFAVFGLLLLRLTLCIPNNREEINAGSLKKMGVAVDMAA